MPARLTADAAASLQSAADAAMTARSSAAVLTVRADRCIIASYHRRIDADEATDRRPPEPPIRVLIVDNDAAHAEAVAESLRAGRLRLHRGHQRRRRASR